MTVNNLPVTKITLNGIRLAIIGLISLAFFQNQLRKLVRHTFATQYLYQI